MVDQRLPDIEGLAVIDALRALGSTAGHPITTNPARALRRRAEEADVTIVEKPLNSGTLFERTDATLKPRPTHPDQTSSAGQLIGVR